MRQPIYLDYNATAPLRPEAREAMLRALGSVGNASSIHSFGRTARLVVEDARKVIASVAGAQPEEVIFNSGGTEGNATALQGLEVASVFVSATSHASVLLSIDSGFRRNDVIPVLSSGLLDLSAAERLIAAAPKPCLVSIEWVNNETGVIQPVAALLEMVRRHGGYLHVDGVQALGKVALDVRPDLLTLSAHKIGGAQGVGALIVRDGLPFMPLLRGGGQEKNRRAGTENVAGIASFSAAVQALTPLDSAWREDFEARIQKVPGVRIMGGEVPRVANTTCFVFPGLSAEIMLMKLDLAGFAVSSGSACSSGKVTSSHVLKAMGASVAEMASALRVSFGWNTSQNELISLAECWTEMAPSVIK